MGVGPAEPVPEQQIVVLQYDAILEVHWLINIVTGERKEVGDGWDNTSLVSMRLVK